MERRRGSLDRPSHTALGTKLMNDKAARGSRHWKKSESETGFGSDNLKSGSGLRCAGPLSGSGKAGPE